MEGGDWGSEETDQPNFPFEPEDRFAIDILCLPDQYKVTKLVFFILWFTFLTFSHIMSKVSRTTLINKNVVPFLLARTEKYRPGLKLFSAMAVGL